MTITCSACSWPEPALISEHGAVRYWRCLCGQWLVSEAGAVTASPGTGDLVRPDHGNLGVRSLTGIRRSPGQV